MPCPGWGYNNNWVYQKRFSGLDPVQAGNVPDCSLMTALSSLAWTCYVHIKNQDGSGSVTLNFWNTQLNPPGWSPGYTAARNEVLPVNATGNLCCATSAGGPNETWPGIYEKLYARFLGVAPDPNSPANPDICSGWPPGGNALDALVALTGWTNNSDVSANYRSILSNLTMNQKTKYPVVAWTSALPGLRKDKNYAIREFHCYSVLGTYSAGGTDYLVLRNPLGSVIANPEISANNLLTAGAWTFTDKCWKRGATEYTAVYSPVPPERPCDGKRKTRYFDQTPGLFAVAVGEFSTYFDRFGWVT